jgi:hypothetical protein
VVYRAHCTDGTDKTVNSPGDLPEATKREGISEPYCRLEMVTPKEYVGPLMDLATGRRGEFVEMKYLTGARGRRGAGRGGGRGGAGRGRGRRVGAARQQGGKGRLRGARP